MAHDRPLVGKGAYGANNVFAFQQLQQVQHLQSLGYGQLGQVG
jgi:hypothetical protein